MNRVFKNRRYCHWAPLLVKKKNPQCARHLASTKPRGEVPLSNPRRKKEEAGQLRPRLSLDSVGPSSSVFVSCVSDNHIWLKTQNSVPDAFLSINTLYPQKFYWRV